MTVQNTYLQNVHTAMTIMLGIGGKGKGFPILDRYTALGPELIPVYRQSARR